MNKKYKLNVWNVLLYLGGAGGEVHFLEKKKDHLPLHTAGYGPVNPSKAGTILEASRYQWIEDVTSDSVPSVWPNTWSK